MLITYDCYWFFFATSRITRVSIEISYICAMHQVNYAINEVFVYLTLRIFLRLVFWRIGKILQCDYTEGGSRVSENSVSGASPSWRRNNVLKAADDSLMRHTVNDMGVTFGKWHSTRRVSTCLRPRSITMCVQDKVTNLWGIKIIKQWLQLSLYFCSTRSQCN